MQKIAIDARFYGTGHTGLGRYTTNVLKYLPKYLQGYTLQVLLRDSEYDNFPSGKNIVKIHAEIPHYSLAEQIMMPRIIKSIGAELLYTLHFNAPIFAGIPSIVTVHDLIKSHFTGKDTTTRAPWLYQIKRFGYNQVIKNTLLKASEIIVPSNTVKNDVLAMIYGVLPEKIHQIEEAPDEIFRSSNSLKDLKNLPLKYILFVGNAYPHKNLIVLLEAMKSLPDYELVIVAKSTPFLSRALSPYDQTKINLLQNLSDLELVSVYKQASLLVTPSFMEGYGLVGLESLMVGTKVVASKIPVYREVYGDKVTYFDPNSSKDLVKAINVAIKQTARNKFKFDRTWDDVAREISEVIHARCSSL